jgi:Ser/Thr protein kinase RdoA (MazF antagonist)
LRPFLAIAADIGVANARTVRKLGPVPAPTGDPGLAAELARGYDLRVLALRRLDVLVNDVFAVTAEEGRFALKLYHQARTPAAVGWELDLVDHLYGGGAPVVRPVPGRTGRLQRLRVAGRERIGALFTWAAGSKPGPGPEVYRRLGAAAGRIHAAADGFAPSPHRETYDLALLIDEQLDRMRPMLQGAGCWSATVALGERLRGRLADPALDHGICHMDLTLDNVHLAPDGALTVFDFDSAGPCWRAAEPWGVLRYSAPGFAAGSTATGPCARSAHTMRPPWPCSGSSATSGALPGSWGWRPRPAAHPCSLRPRCRRSSRGGSTGRPRT